jgi:hypothetical protein
MVHSVVIYGTGYYLWYIVLLFMVQGVIIYGIGCYYLWYIVLLFMVQGVIIYVT